MKYGYARVSTIHQDLETQINMLEEEGCDKIITEKISGTKNSRPNFDQLIVELNEGDTLVVTKVDRFARNTRNALDVIYDLFNRGVRVHILNMGIIENTPTGRLIFSIFSAFAEFERDMIVERTQEGKQLAKQRPGFREGRPRKFSKKQIELALHQLETHSYKEVTEMTGISESTLLRCKRAKSIESLTGFNPQ